MSDKKYIVRIKVPNMPVESKEKLKHLAENLGFDSVSELCKTKLKENLKKYDDLITKENQEVEIKKTFFFITGVKITMKNDLTNIAKALGFQNTSDYIRSFLMNELKAQPKYMLKKNKGFKEIDE